MLAWHEIVTHARRDRYFAAALVALRAAALDPDFQRLAESCFAKGPIRDPLFHWSAVIEQYRGALHDPRTAAFLVAAIRAYCGRYPYEDACEALGLPAGLALQVLVWDGGLDMSRSAAVRMYVALLRSDSEELLARVTL